MCACVCLCVCVLTTSRPNVFQLEYTPNRVEHWVVVHCMQFTGQNAEARPVSFKAHTELWHKSFAESHATRSNVPGVEFV